METTDTATHVAGESEAGMGVTVTVTSADTGEHIAEEVESVSFVTSKTITFVRSQITSSIQSS